MTVQVVVENYKQTRCFLVQTIVTAFTKKISVKSQLSKISFLISLSFKIKIIIVAYTVFLKIIIYCHCIEQQAYKTDLQYGNGLLYGLCDDTLVISTRVSLKLDTHILKISTTCMIRLTVIEARFQDQQSVGS